MEVQHDKIVAWDSRSVMKRLTDSGTTDTETDTAAEVHYKAGGVTWILSQLDRTAEHFLQS